jgi:predicted urease superfamily metal-dependent hydrolase
MSERRQKMFFVAPDLEDADFREGDYLDKDDRTNYMNKVVIAKKEADIREKLPETKEKVEMIMNKATKLL